MPLPEDHQEQGITVPALIWRYWRAHGGIEQFGPPLAPAERAGGTIRQFFTRALLELHPDQADTPYLVQPAPLGRGVAAGRTIAPASETPGARFFPESGHTLREAFATYWEQRDGMLLFGLPISEEFDAPAADGARRTMQLFERAALAYYPEDGSVRPEPLGWAALVRNRLQSTMAAQQIR
jgi:hypothetical protein